MPATHPEPSPEYDRLDGNAADCRHCRYIRKRLEGQAQLGGLNPRGRYSLPWGNTTVARETTSMKIDLAFCPCSCHDAWRMLTGNKRIEPVGWEMTRDEAHYPEGL